MAFLRALVLYLPWFFIFDASHSIGQETVTVDKAFNGREIKVRSGGIIRVDLEELGAAGYAWTIQDVLRDHFEILSVRTEEPPLSSEVTGKPVIKTWLIRATKAGRAELKFLNYRPWEGQEKAVDSFVLRVIIL